MSIVSREAQIRFHELDRTDDLYRNYGYAYELNDTNDVYVTHWGRPSNFDHIYCRDGLACEAATWVVLWVAVSLFVRCAVVLNSCHVGPSVVSVVLRLLIY